MLDTIRNAWKLPDLRKRILYTVLVIIIFRIGSAITVPFLNPVALKSFMTNSSNSLMGYIDVFTGGAFTKATIFAMSITPYINSSIIIQLLAVIIPSLAAMQKEGEVGRKRLTQITRYVAVGLGLFQGIFLYLYLLNNGVVVYSTGFSGVWAAIVIVTSFSAGTALLMWLGEQINDKGVGNGISIILFAGIISRGPVIVSEVIKYWTLGGQFYFLVPLMVILAVAVIASIVLMNNAERRIPVQYAKRQVGRKMYGGQSSYVPIKVTMSGVMPIIFASSIVSIPSLMASFVSDQKSVLYQVLTFLGYNNWLYAILYFILIIGFNFFYVTITYNPIEISNNLKKNNGVIPGIRTGKPTSDYINRCLSRITLIGALFLGAVAILPIIISMSTGIQLALGGTTLLIVVGVALDTTRQMESQMMMRHYKGFLE